MLLPYVLLALTGCDVFYPCNSCKEFGAFMDACMDDLDEAHIAADCALDAEAYVDWTESQDRSWSELEAEGVVRYCETAAEAERSCNAVHRERWSRMSAEEKDAEQQTCNEPDAWSEAIESQDCDAFLELLGAR